MTDQSKIDLNNFKASAGCWVTDATLQDLCQDDSYRQLGMLSPQHSKMLAGILPSLCAELLARRAAMGDSTTLAPVIDRDDIPFPQPRSHAEEIANARATPRHPATRIGE